MSKRNPISEQWAARSIEMLESPAYRVLSLAAHRILSRIEIEFAHHGGQDNGKLPVTFDDFARYGVHRASIGPAIAELEALSFIVVTERGKMAKAAEYRRPNKFLLTSRPRQKGIEVASKWRRFTTLKEAEAVATAARMARAGKNADTGEKKKPPVRKPYQRPVRNPYQSGQIASTETVPLRMSESVPLSISRVGHGPDDSDGGTPPNLATPIADDAPALGDALPSNALTPIAAGPKLAWSRPVVREPFGEERRERLEEIEQVDRGANRVACGPEAGVLQ